MKILIVEDNDNRIKWFKQKYIGNTVICTKDAQEGIKYLQSNDNFDLLFLDHDLADEHYANQGISNKQNSGYAVALFLEEHTENNPEMQVIIHSLNTTGSERMYQALCKTRYVNKVPYNILSKPT
jgi:CheY-like chemotaxis protein